MKHEDKPNSPKGMKIIIPGLCPHCSQEIMITVATTMPHLLSIHTNKDFDSAKEKALGILETITFKTEEHKKMAVEYVNNLSFGPSEVDDVIEQITEQQAN